MCVKNTLKMWLLEFQCGFLKIPLGSHSGFLKLTSSTHGVCAVIELILFSHKVVLVSHGVSNHMSDQKLEFSNEIIMTAIKLIKSYQLKTVISQP